MASPKSGKSRPSSALPSVRSPLLASINETHKAVELVLNNHFEEAQKLLETQRRTSIYHALGYATILYLRAGMTFEHQAFNDALVAIGESLKVVNSRRRGWSFFRSSNSHATIDSFTNEQLHAELCHAELLLEQSMITMMLNEANIFRMFGALIGVNDAFSTYRYCYTILEKRTWKRARADHAKSAAAQAETGGKTGTKVESDEEAKNKQDAEEDEELKQHFESGVRLGLGAFNVLLSSMPDVAIRMLALVGISGRRQFGFQQMRLASEMRNGETIRGILAAIALLAFHLVVAYSFGTADGDLEWCERTLDRALTRFERCAIFLYFSGRLQLVRGCVVDASIILQRAIDAQTEWRELHYACRWEMMWCAAFSARWLEAYRHADSLFRCCSWSKCLFAYCSAVFLLQHRAALSSGALQLGAEEEADTDTDAYADEKSQVRKMAGDKSAIDKRIDELLALVPTSMQRLAGKHLPLEKLAERRAQQFSTLKQLTLPAFELIYVFCGVPMLANNEELLASFIAVVDAELRLRKLPLATDTLEQALGQCTQRQSQSHADRSSTDEACFLYLLKAACLSNRPADDTAASQGRLLTDRQDACTFLSAVVNQEKDAKAQAVEYETYLYPCAKVELALLKLKTFESTQDAAAHEAHLAEVVQLLESAEKDHPKYFLRSRVHVRIRSLLNNVAPRLEQLRARRTGELSKTRHSSASSNGNLNPSIEHLDDQSPSTNRLKVSASETGFNRIG